MLQREAADDAHNPERYGRESPTEGKSNLTSKRDVPPTDHNKDVSLNVAPEKEPHLTRALRSPLSLSSTSAPQAWRTSHWNPRIHESDKRGGGAPIHILDPGATPAHLDSLFGRRSVHDAFRLVAIPARHS